MRPSFESRASGRAPQDDVGVAARSPSFLAQLRPYPSEHVAEHLWRQHPRIGVVTRAMIAVVKVYRAGSMHRAMRERCGGAAKLQHLQHRFMRHAAERHDRPQPWHRRYGCRQELPGTMKLKLHRRTPLTLLEPMPS